MTIVLARSGTGAGGGETRMGEKNGTGTGRGMSEGSGGIVGCSAGVLGVQELGSEEGTGLGAGRRGLWGCTSSVGCGSKPTRTLVSLRASSGVRTTTAPLSSPVLLGECLEESQGMHGGEQRADCCRATMRTHK